jgi:hypothetical protein
MPVRPKMLLIANRGNPAWIANSPRRSTALGLLAWPHSLIPAARLAM